MVDPVYVTLGFILFAIALMWRGKILRSRAVRELTNMGMDSLRVMYLIAEHADVNRIAEAMQIRVDQLGDIVEDLVDKGFIAQGGMEVYQLTQKGLRRLGSIPKWIRVSLVEKEGKNT
jgi:predicted transcriptional regulator